MSKSPPPWHLDEVRELGEARHLQGVQVSTRTESFVRIMFLKNSIISFVIGLASAIPNDAAIDFLAPVESTEEYHHFLAKIPAPRGLIVDRTGKTLAVSRSGKRLAVRLLKLKAENPNIALAEAVADFSAALCLISPSIQTLDTDNLDQHFKHRPYTPFPISGLLPNIETLALAELDEEGVPALAVQDIITREYPGGVATGHVVGFVGQSMPDQHGPYGKSEYLWPTMEGRRGLEESFDEILRGTDGLISLLYDSQGNEVNREILHAPVPGATIVTTIDLGMQKLALEQLEKSKHNGAFVAVDSETGDILALASHPGFDPNEFVPNISAARFLELSREEGAPFFDRAVSGSYPPGSTFKPIIALAGLGSGMISRDTKFPGPPSYYVGGHEFKNWNDQDEGSLDVRFAMLRSCNTWFYQAAIQTRSEPIIEAASRFRIGSAPPLPLKGVSAGFMPRVIPSDGRIANVAIGQGQVLASPLQMAAAMTGFANRDRIATPRLVIQTQHPISGRIEKTFLPASTPLCYPEETVNTVREGLWGVVNHGSGTGRAAALSKPHVFGKTGTAQWFTGGEERRLGWFTGFVDAENPKIAFAVLAEGAIDEKMSGGRNAAPYAGNFLREIYGEPERFLVSVPEEILTPAPRLTAATRSHARESRSSASSASRRGSGQRAAFAPVVVAPPAQGVRPQRRDLLSRLFGRPNGR